MKTKISKILTTFGLFSVIAVMSLINFSCSESVNIPGYKLIEKRFVKEVNADVYYFEHIKSGAHIVKIASEDKNKTFAAGFITEPNSDCGTPHIIEHSVLNGSRNFPVKSPFEEMGKTSMSTFLNAFTSQHWTFYPVASMNNNDYYNLMTVYLDAVFFPLITEDPRILMQEGWHYELENADAPIVYKGVVYNEMKGSFSNPQSELHYQVIKNLFPDNGFGKSSGGHPMAIPQLTYEDFVKFYKEHYHPANSCIFLYGNADMNKEMQIINEDYLSKFDKIDIDKQLKPQEPFAEFKKVTAPYSVNEGSPTQDQTFLSINWVYGKSTDPNIAFALDLATDVLVSQEAAPIRLALQEANIGKDVYAYCNPELQNTITIGVNNANPEDADRFKEIVLNVMKEQAEKGLDHNALEAALNRKEFRLREGNNAQKGLSYALGSFTEWIFTGDPFKGLEWEKEIAGIKQVISEGFIEKTILEGIVNNNFGVLVVLEPKPGLEKEINQQIEKELADYKASLSKEEIEKLVATTQELIEHQKREDSDSALATIPRLTRADIGTEAEWWEVTEKQIAETKVLHYEEFTNNVVYANLMFNMQVVPQELIQYTVLLSEMLGMLSTENYNYGDLEIEVKKQTGSLNTYTELYRENLDDNKLLPKFVLSSKALPDRVSNMFALTEEVLLKTNFTDKDRLKVMLARIQSNMENSVKTDGINYASIRMSSYGSNTGMFDELTGGMEYYWFLNKLYSDFDTKSDEIIARLVETAKLLFNKNNMIVGVACDKNDYAALEKELGTFINKLPSAPPAVQEWKFELSKKNEGLMAASKVQYVVQGANYKELGYEWSGKMRILSSIISKDYLQNTIRVLGGAYGGWSRISKDGIISFSSYRDPNLTETLENYSSCTQYLETFEADEDKMLGYIISAVSEMDYPFTASQKASIAYSRYLQKETKEQLQADRDAMMATTVEDIRAFAPMITDFIKQNTYCVYGNKEKIEQNKAIFGTLINVESK